MCYSLFVFFVIVIVAMDIGNRWMNSRTVWSLDNESKSSPLHLLKWKHKIKPYEMSQQHMNPSSARNLFLIIEISIQSDQSKYLFQSNSAWLKSSVSIRNEYIGRWVHISFMYERLFLFLLPHSQLINLSFDCI